MTFGLFMFGLFSWRPFSQNLFRSLKDIENFFDGKVQDFLQVDQLDERLE